jgi:DNA-binding NtrC family response regulator
VKRPPITSVTRPGPVGTPLPVAHEARTPAPRERAAAAGDGAGPGLDAGAPRLRVIIVEDEPPLRRTLARILEVRGMEVMTCEDGVEAMALVAQERADVMLLDLMLPRMDGMEVLRRSKIQRPDMEVVMMTAFGEVDTAVQAVKAGAYDFLTKPFASPDAVALVVEKAAERRRLIDRARQLEAALESQGRGSDLIGTTRKMQEVMRLVNTVAQSITTVLVRGESGTGKELVARAIHQGGPRGNRPFLAVNCSAIPSTLIDSELFGHVKGAFTGASVSRDGLFAAADGGTLFLDEIGDLPLASQVRLLRVLQEGEIKPVGSNEVRTVDVRVIAATNVDLLQAIANGTFREDLYYRLCVIEVHLPPLRERREDIPLLATFFLRKLARKNGREIPSIDTAAMRVLSTAPWPGNVRELENAIERAMVLSRAEILGIEDFARLTETTAEAARTDGAFGAELAELPYRDAKRVALRTFEKHYVASLLGKTNANVSQAARIAGLDRSNFRRIVRKCGK